MKKSHTLLLMTTFVLTVASALFASIEASNAEVIIHLNRNMNRNLSGRLNRMIERVCIRLPNFVTILGWCEPNSNSNQNDNSNAPTNENSNQNSNENSNSNQNSNSNTNEPTNDNTNNNSNSNSNSNSNTNTPGSGQSSSGVLISEVFQTTPNNAEWVEIYNGSGIAMDFNGWMIGDAASFDTIPATGLVPNGGTLVIVATSTANFLEPLPANAVKIFIDTTITSSGMSAAGEAIVLKNDQGTIVDAMNYGSVTTQFSPSIATAPVGHSYFRTPVTTDTNTATDWDHHIPNPGVAP